MATAVDNQVSRHGPLGHKPQKRKSGRANHKPDAKSGAVAPKPVQEKRPEVRFEGRKG
jgi:hypothetical protein